MNILLDAGVKLFSRKAPASRGGMSRKARSQTAQQTRRVNCYGGVEVVCASNEIDSRDLCDAYHKQKNTRYLSADAPNLPLAGCDKGSCKCRYQYFDDRRKEERRNVFGMQNAINRSSSRSDKRIKRDRRKGSVSHPIN